MVIPVQTTNNSQANTELQNNVCVRANDPLKTEAELELRAAIRVGNQRKAVQVLERAPYLRIHASKPRPIDEALNYWSSVCQGE